ncbi:MAG: transcriptional repressor [Bdellovibrionales bacterium]|nr:transcriptional repressor [Bdellovibrionales bacterium]
MENKLPHLQRGQQNSGYFDGNRSGLPSQQVEVLVKRDAWDEGTFKRIIREMGLKVTGQRMAILKALTAGRAHVTAQEVFEQIKEPHPEIGFATVYRFLRKMSEKQLVTEVRMGGSPARYELTPRRHHDHLTCTRCGRIVEFENSHIEQLQVKVAKEKGFILTHHVLELYGHCQKCQR